MSPTYDYTNKHASFHSRQGKIWRFGSMFLFVCFRIGMSHENNSSSVWIAQLSLVNNAVAYALPRSTSFRNHRPKQARGPTVGVDLQPEALALSKEKSPISSWFY